MNNFKEHVLVQFQIKMKDEILKSKTHQNTQYKSGRTT